jgi:hypothetical protein
VQQGRRSGTSMIFGSAPVAKPARFETNGFSNAQLDSTFVNSGASHKNVRVCSPKIFSARSSHEKELDVSRSSVIRTRALNDRPD